MKKMICILLALLLLAQPAALAAPEPAPSLEILGEVAVPEEVPAPLAAAPEVISVSVPDTGWVIVNPYRLDVVRDGMASSRQVVSPAMVLQNQSAVPVRVDARALGTVPAGSGAKFAPWPPAPDTAEKEVFLFLEFQTFWGGDTLWTGEFNDSPNQLAVSPLGAEKQGVMTMEVGGQGALRVFGSAAEAPASAWTAADTVDISVAFTFTPAVG